jgi:hypothetical protein
VRNRANDVLVAGGPVLLHGPAGELVVLGDAFVVLGIVDQVQLSSLPCNFDEPGQNCVDPAHQILLRPENFTRSRQAYACEVPALCNYGDAQSSSAPRSGFRR